MSLMDRGYSRLKVRKIHTYLFLAMNDCSKSRSQRVYMIKQSASLNVELQYTLQRMICWRLPVGCLAYLAEVKLHRVYAYVRFPQSNTFKE